MILDPSVLRSKFQLELINLLPVEYQLLLYNCQVWYYGGTLGYLSLLFCCLFKFVFIAIAVLRLKVLFGYYTKIYQCESFELISYTKG